ncbi:MAG: hypothetical protein JWQ27_1230 [Ferruginibacter sp.]|nr:hypothetical protein [Ferruginibacter sp.]
MAGGKLNIRKLIFTILWILVGSGTIVLLAAAVNNKGQKKCRGIEISITGSHNNFFIDKNDVSQIINRFAGTNLKGRAIESFNLRSIEAELKKDVWIKNAELFFDNNDILQADIEEREPVGRVFTLTGNSFYIDSSAMMLPLSEKVSARVPVFTGFTTDAKILFRADSTLLFAIRDLSIAMQADSFLMAMIDQVDITAQRNFEMMPKIGKQLIVFGDATDIQAKFGKLKLFYKNIITKAGWNRYSNIDLQYQNQVVARIRGKEEIVADSLRTLTLMKMIAENAAKQSADSLQTFHEDNEKNTADSSLIQQSLQRDEIAEPSTSNSIEKPSPQEAAPVTKLPVPVLMTRPVSVKPGSGKPVVKKPVASPVKKPLGKKPAATPKAVMKANDY